MQVDWLTVRLARESDVPFLVANDPYITVTMMQRKVADDQILIALAGQEPIGFLRWGLFWDNTPFMYLLYVLEAWRRKGTASQLIAHWEALMRANGEESVLTSTLSAETAQHLYRKCGYQDIGGFAFPNEPLKLVLLKQLTDPQGQ